MKHKIMALGLAVVVLAAPALADAGQTEAKAAAGEAAATWLALVDQGKYDESWEGAAQLFKGVVKGDVWAAQLSGVRAPLGKLLSRELKSSQYAESLPGAPDGQYVILQYEASFEGKKSAIETVTPMLDPDGTWRVSGYFIK